MPQAQQTGEKKQRFAVLAIMVLAGLFLFLGNRIATGGRPVFAVQGNAEVVSAQVKLILTRNPLAYYIEGREIDNTLVYFDAVITSGERKGEQVVAQQLMDSMLAVPMKEVQEGDYILLCYTKRGVDIGRAWYFQEYDRRRPLAALGAVFIGLLLLFGGRKGVGTVLSLSFTGLAVFGVLIPAILSGRNVYGSVLVVSVAIIAVTLTLVNGLHVKSLSAALGCIGGLGIATVLLLVMDRALFLTGLIDEDSAFLLMLDPPVHLKAVLFGAIVIGVLGAALDVGVSISSALSELLEGSPHLGWGDIMRSGMNIGRDILCTMTNTLILVYIGGALSSTLLLTVYSNSMLEMLNREMIVVEILQALVSSTGLLFVIPITTGSFALFARPKERRLTAAPGRDTIEPPTFDKE